MKNSEVLGRDDIIDVISAASKNSAEHDIAYALRLMQIVLDKYELKPRGSALASSEG